MTELEQLRKNLKKIKVKDYPNTFLSIVNKTRDEVLMTKILAFLFNPKNTSINILKGMLEMLDMEDIANDLDVNNYVDERIDERRIDGGRSILDLLIKFNNCWIVIENKIDSTENWNQTDKYVKSVKKENKEKIPVVFIYLKPKKANTKSPENKEFKVIEYDDIVEILKKCSIYDFYSRENYFYMEDIIKHMEGYLMTDNMLAFGEEIEFYLEHKDKIIKIEDSYKEQCRIVKELLAENIDCGLPEFIVYPNLNQGWIQIFKDNWFNNNHKGIHYEILFNSKHIIDSQSEITFRLDIEPEAKAYRVVLQDIDIEIQKTMKFDLSTPDNIRKSISAIIEEQKSIDKKYTHQIDEKLLLHNNII